MYVYMFICIQYIYIYYNDMQNMCIVCVAGPSKIRELSLCFFTNSWLRKSRWLRLKMFLTGASHPCLPLRLEALEAANAGESQR